MRDREKYNRYQLFKPRKIPRILYVHPDVSRRLEAKKLQRKRRVKPHNRTRRK